jgi:hypothetical protein
MGNRKAVSTQNENLMRREHWIYTLPLRLRSLFRRPQVDQDLDEEIRDHPERRTEEYVAQGLSRERPDRRAPTAGGADIAFMSVTV